MKKLILICLMAVLAFESYGQLVITEIMYNPPESGTDVTEFVEIFNNSDQEVNLNGYEIKDAIQIVFGDTTVAPGAFIVITVNSASFNGYYGFEAIQWTGGALNNSGETITLLDPADNPVDAVSFSDKGDWPVEADGSGYSLELCHPDLDNSLATNWKISNHPTGLVIDGKALFASPGLVNILDCEEAVIHVVDVETLAFNPKDLEISPGETVKWINLAAGNHNIDGRTSVFPNNPESFYSGAPSTDNWSYEFTFNVPGVYQYRSELYQFLGMTGTITVRQDMSLSITEIMYNDPTNTDSLEFVEIYNHGDTAVTLTGYSLEFNKSGKVCDLPDFLLEPKHYFTISGDTTVFKRYFGFKPATWNAVAVLANDGDQITLKNAAGTIVAQVNYGVSAPWPEAANGQGHSLSLCKPKSQLNDPLNWQATPFPAGSFLEGKELHATPGKPGYCEFPVAEIKGTKADGTLVENGNGVTLEGTVYGVNLKPVGLQFTLIDDQNKGIAIYSETKDFGIAVEEGQDLRIMGILGQYNGLGQVYVDTLFVPGTTSVLFEPTLTTVLGEATESQLVKIANVYLQNPENWVPAGSGFTVRVTDGTNIYSIRIDDNVDLFNLQPPTGTFSVTGIGGQFDSTSPFHEGYQLLPRYVEDIDPYNTQLEIPLYPIGLLRTVNDQGVADSLGVRCRIKGVVYGPNYRQSGLSFTMIDEFNDGLYVFLNSGNLGYAVKQGDLLEVTGTIAQFNGLTQIVPEKIVLISGDNPLFEAAKVTALNESTESQLVMIENVSLVNPSEWKGDGTTFNVSVTNGTNTFLLRIHPSSGISTLAAPQGTFNAVGIGSQFDSSSPYNEGYQLFPRQPSDLGLSIGIENISRFDPVISPNPAGHYFKVIYGENIMDFVQIFDHSGRKMAEFQQVQPGVPLPCGQLAEGLYYIRVVRGKSAGYTKLLIAK